MADLQGSVVVITGASAGVGRAISRAFAERGARLGLIARGEERLRAAKEELEACGAQVEVFAADVSDEDQVERAAAHFEATLGPIDVWINNAMATIFSPFWEMSPDEFRRSTEVTYLGSIWGTMVALRRMRPRDRGTIVQVGSALAYRGIPLQAPYCGAKHALQGFLESLRTELAHDGSEVRVTMVQLPALNTPQFDWGRSHMQRRARPVPPIFQPEVAARAIVWAAEHPERRELFVGWPTIRTVFGNRFAGWLADKYLARNGYELQLTPEARDESAPDNLFEAAPGSWAAHGRFDDDAKDRSLALDLTLHRRAVGIAALAAGAGLLTKLARR